MLYSAISKVNGMIWGGIESDRSVISSHVAKVIYNVQQMSEIITDILCCKVYMFIFYETQHGDELKNYFYNNTTLFAMFTPC